LFTLALGPVRSRLSRRDAEIALFRSCLHFGRQGKPAALFQMSAVTADSREWPFSFCTPWQMVKFLGAGLRQHAPQKSRPHTLVKSTP
jgi:hypothetical protein